MPARKLLTSFVFFVSAGWVYVAAAASPDAWAAFRKEVEVSCRAAGNALIENPTVTVDPFGSQSYGLAFLTGKAVDDGGDRSLVCVYDKVKHTSEIGGAMALQRSGAAAIAGSQAMVVDEPAAVSRAEADALEQAAEGTTQAAASPAAPDAIAPPVAAAPNAAPSNTTADAALADRFASFPDDPEEPETGVPSADAGAEPGVSPQNQPVVTPPVPILPNVPGAAGQPQAAGDGGAGETGEGEGEAGDGALANGAAADPQAAAPTAADARVEAPQPFAGCDASCTATLAALAPADQKSLSDLPFEIERTIARNSDADLAAGPKAARTAAGAIAANLTGRPTSAIEAPTAALAGERSCVLYYFGYSNQAARSVGRHRCSVSVGEGGALVVEKISGERLRAELKPLTSSASAFVGRTFKTGQEDTRYDPAKPVSDSDKELGNSVGLATASDGRVMLASSELRRFAGEDNFFWVLAVDPK